MMSAPSQIASATRDAGPASTPGAAGRNASATASRIAARPVLKRKNFTPAWRDTSASVKAMPTPRCARKRKRTVDRDMGGGAGEAGEAGVRAGRRRKGALLPAPPAAPALPAYRSRLLISAQFTTFHH